MSDKRSDANNDTPWHSLDTKDVLEKFQVEESGLSQQEVSTRLDKYGANRLQKQQSRPWWRRLLEQFNSVLIIILIIAGVISAVLGEWVDAGAIFAVVLVNALVGFVQEGKAEKALESIKNMLSPSAQVKRDGEQKTVAAEEVVPGDIVMLQSGDRVPADLRLITAKQLRTQEAPLTGESEPVDKGTEPVDAGADLADRRSMAYASTIVAQGQATGIAVATANKTEIGRISTMISEVEQLQTPLLRQLDHFGRVLATAIIALAVAMAAFGMLVHGHGWREMFMSGVGLAVAAIPQGLPAIITITLALGVQAMAKRNAIIRRLPAVETLGSVSTIFSDKTGTLTCNEMTVSRIALSDSEFAVSGVGFAPEGEFTEPGQDNEAQGADGESGGGDAEQGKPITPTEIPALKQFLISGALCNDSRYFCDDAQHDDKPNEGNDEKKQEEKDEQSHQQWQIDGDPTEGALLVALKKAGLDQKEIAQDHERVDAIPFESERKYMATLNKTPDGDTVVHVKGAPDTILDMCSQVLVSGEKDSEEQTRELDKAQWKERIEDLSSQGLRVLALAYKPHSGGDQIDEQDVESDLVLLGLVGMIDPPRESVADAIDECQTAGIRVKMITGDHALTASAIAKKLGIKGADKPISGSDVEKGSDDDLCQWVADSSVFARAAPEHKLRLVKASQSEGQVCAMTGDGVNDAPALKRANVGVAMGVQGTEAAKEASEMVLADDNFVSIVHAIEEGRKVYNNITKTISFLLPTNGAESLAILLAVVAGTMLPVTPVQILWINMVTAVTLGLALAFEPADPDLMKRQPRDPNAPILNPYLVWRIFFVSVLLVAAVYGLFWWLREFQDVAIEVARSAAVNMLVVGEIAYLLNARFPLARSLSVDGLFGSRPVLIAIALVVVLQVIWTYTPAMQLLFGSAGLSPLHWGVIWLVAMVLFGLVETEKAIVRRHRAK